MDLMSLKAAKAETGAVLQVKNPATEEPLEGVTLTLLGTDSAKYRAIQRRKTQSALDRMSKGRRSLRLKAEETEAEALADLVELTVAWTGITEAGVPVPFGKEAVERYYAELPWLREQAQEFVNDRANFL